MAKRQKIVFADSFDVAHIWMHQTQEESRCRSIFHEGKSIYSYGRHYEIARHVETLSGEPMILFNRDSNSRTTEKHKDTVQMAIPSEAVVLNIPSDGFFDTRVEGTRRTVGEGMYATFVRLFAATFSDILEMSDKQKRARSSDYRGQIASRIVNLRIAYKAFELYRAHRSSGWDKKKIHVPAILDYLSSNKVKKSYYKEYRNYVDGSWITVGQNKDTTWIVPILQKAGMFDMLDDNSDFKTKNVSLEMVDVLLEGIWEGQGDAKTDYEEYTRKLASAARKQEEKERQERMQRAKESIVEWRNGAFITLYDVDETLLRVVRDEDRAGVLQDYVETSKRIRLTVEEAERLWDFWRAVVAKKKGFMHELAVDANGSKWSIQSIDDKGVLKAGCHEIPFKEAEQVARTLNFKFD